MACGPCERARLLLPQSLADRLRKLEAERAAKRAAKQVRHAETMAARRASGEGA